MGFTIRDFFVNVKIKVVRMEGLEPSLPTGNGF